LATPFEQIYFGEGKSLGSPGEQEGASLGVAKDPADLSKREEIDQGDAYVHEPIGEMQSFSHKNYFG
jgi:hypothetical protein